MNNAKPANNRACCALQDTPHTKYIILASHDSAALGATGLLKDRRLLAYLQHTDFSNPEEHNMLVRKRLQNASAA